MTHRQLQWLTVVVGINYVGSELWAVSQRAAGLATWVAPAALPGFILLILAFGERKETDRQAAFPDRPPLTAEQRGTQVLMSSQHGGGCA